MIETEISQGEELRINIADLDGLDMTLSSYKGELVKDNQRTEFEFSNNVDKTVDMFIPDTVTATMGLGYHNGDVFQVSDGKRLKLADIKVKINDSITGL